MRLRSASRAAALVGIAVVLALPAGSTASTAVRRVTVTMTEYRFKLSVKTVHVGTVVFTVVNRGQLPHTFEVQRLKATTPLLQKGQRSTLRVRFRKPGRYYYLCTVDNHVLFGMAGYLLVTP
jgi:plastocyanin